MQIYKEYLSFKSIFYFCSLPLRLDTYRGCNYACSYCFSRSLNNRKEKSFSNVIPTDPKKFRTKMENIWKDGEIGIVRSCLQHELPIHFGNVSDPFQPIERKLGISYEFLKVLNDFDYPTMISTKSDLLVANKYLNLIKNLPVGIQISFSTFDDELAKKIEPNAPSPTRRLEVLEKLSNSGIWTAIRLQPFLFPISSIEDINFRYFSDIGVKHIVLEHLRIPTNSSINSRMNFFDLLGVNMLDVYKKLGIQISRINYELSTDIKLQNFLSARKSAHEFGLTFSSGDNDLHFLSDYPCCCGIPNNEKFNNYYKGHLGYSLSRSLKTNNISFDNVDNEWQPSGKISEFINSHCRTLGNIGIKEYLHNRIENPDNSNSPLSFGGVIRDQNSIYRFQDEFLSQVLE